MPFLISQGSDTWGSYRTERSELIAFFVNENIRNLVVLSADYHMALDVELPRFHEFLAGPIGAWPQCQMNTGALQRLQTGGRVFVCDGPTYGAVIVRPEMSPAEIEVHFVDAKATVRHRKVIQAT